LVNTSLISHTPALSALQLSTLALMCCIVARQNIVFELLRYPRAAAANRQEVTGQVASIEIMMLV